MKHNDATPKMKVDPESYVSLFLNSSLLNLQFFLPLVDTCFREKSLIYVEVKEVNSDCSG